LDQTGTTEELEIVENLIPEEWLAPAAYGTPDDCVKAINHQFDLGADGVILHGASPLELEPIVKAYGEQRDASRFDHLPANPALAPGLN
jgi:alkanesulfonate monooxygenase SsuD/methylene tetrahydromethanopterin reductase-like flavin-dependent oxidoreductase (luciferase family)